MDIAAIKSKTTLDTQDILQLLPHRYPMLLVDRLKYTSADRLSATGYKGITINEPCFPGHFPGNPIFPGVLQIEAMAQAGGLMIMGGHPEVEISSVYLVKIDKVRYRAPVYPGNMLELHVRAVQQRGLTVKFEGKGVIDGKVMSEATFMAAGMLAEGQDAGVAAFRLSR